MPWSMPSDRALRPLTAPRLAALYALCLLSLCLLAAPRAAGAAQGERELWVAAGVDAGLDRLGVDLGASHWWRDLVAVDAALDLRLGLGAPLRDTAGVGARLGARVALDALTYCPWLGVSGGAGLSRAGVGWLGRAEAGVHFRPHRDYSLHLRVALRLEGVAGVLDQRWMVLIGASRWTGGAGDLDF